MKKFKKPLAIILCLVLISSCFTLTAFAATKDNVKQYGKEEGALYLSIGDSYSRGDCLDSSAHNRTSPLSYVSLMAKATGYEVTTDKIGVKPTENFVPVNFNALSVDVILNILGINKYSDYLTRAAYGEATALLGKDEKKLKSYIENANLITLEIGMSDALLEPEDKACLEAGVDSFNPSEMTAEQIETYLNALIRNLWECYNRWKDDYPKLLDYIK